jgi:hypothetical protein
MADGLVRLLSFEVGEGLELAGGLTCFGQLLPELGCLGRQLGNAGVRFHQLVLVLPRLLVLLFNQKPSLLKLADLNFGLFHEGRVSEDLRLELVLLLLELGQLGCHALVVRLPGEQLLVRVVGLSLQFVPEI